ncbi:MAG: hypothetical protein BAJATHORv1_90075 [Candidatus Thorarchaeota archaeon]|nr:MAG: hypothetical protein BAJATHORv1_90075 [Candidatus Thorarchaeota archaeon]
MAICLDIIHINCPIANVQDHVYFNAFTDIMERLFLPIISRSGDNRLIIVSETLYSSVTRFLEGIKDPSQEEYGSSGEVIGGGEQK